MPVGQRLNWLLDLVMERQTREPTPPFARPARCGGGCDNTLNSSRGRLLQRNGAWTPSSMGAATLVMTTTWQMFRNMVISSSERDCNSFANTPLTGPHPGPHTKFYLPAPGSLLSPP